MCRRVCVLGGGAIPVKRWHCFVQEPDGFLPFMWPLDVCLSTNQHTTASNMCSQAPLSWHLAKPHATSCCAAGTRCTPQAWQNSCS
jgi:hypothetical protein